MTALPRLMAVTRGDDRQLDVALASIAAPVLVQLRDKAASAAELQSRARRLADRCVLSINIGGAGGAIDAVGLARYLHLPEAAPRPAPGALPYGRSVHSIEAARREAAGAAYLVAGPVWPTTGKPDGLGLEGLAAICDAAGEVPVFAIGGVIDVDRAIAAIDAGAFGVAGIRGFSGDSLIRFARLIGRLGKRS